MACPYKVQGPREAQSTKKQYTNWCGIVLNVEPFVLKLSSLSIKYSNIGCCWGRWLFSSFLKILFYSTFRYIPYDIILIMSHFESSQNIFNREVTEPLWNIVIVRSFEKSINLNFICKTKTLELPRSFKNEIESKVWVSWLCLFWPRVRWVCCCSSWVSLRLASHTRLTGIMYWIPAPAYDPAYI